MKAINPNSSWIYRLIDLLNTIEPIHHQAMGFPDDWKDRDIWK
jgi:hypothetical protein